MNAMSFDLQKILESKRAQRRDLAARPVAEKLRMLDALRERELAIRGRTIHSASGTVREEPAPYSNKPIMSAFLEKNKTHQLFGEKRPGLLDELSKSLAA